MFVVKSSVSELLLKKGSSDTISLIAYGGQLC